MLANDGSLVYSVDVDSIMLLERGKIHPTTKSVEQAVRASDVVVTGVPDRDFKLQSDWVRPGCTVLNISE